MENKLYKVLGFMCLHYGKTYLEASLQSIEPFVDMMHISYVRNPSHGIKTSMENPDTEEELYNIAIKVLKNKLIWESADSYETESLHRHRRYAHSERYDIIYSHDGDEVVEPSEMRIALNYIYNGEARYYGIKGYKNYFRSFSHFCDDGFRPIRGENLHRQNYNQDLECPLTIHHFSLAMPIEVLKYKFSCFGHASEIRPNYLEEIFIPWTPKSDIEFLHPVSLSIWQKTKWADKHLLPQCLLQHPNFIKYVI